MPAASETRSSPKSTDVRLVKAGSSPQARLAGQPHILLVVDQFSRTLGGGERVLLKVAQELPNYGFNVSILALAIDPQSPIFNMPASCSIYELPIQRAFSPTSLPAALRLRRFLRTQDIRIVQTFFESSDLWVGPVAKLLAGTRLLWSRRDMGILRQPKHSKAYRLMARLPDHVFAVSDQVRNYTIEVDRVPSDRVETLYNGLDLARWSSLASPTENPDAPLIVTVGNIRRVKGHDIFIRAAAIIAMKFPGARFSIAGEILDPGYYAELVKLAAELGLGDRVSFAGNITDLPAYLQYATLFVLPSRSEGFSNAIIEAMAASLPVIATDVGGNAEAIADNKTGRIIPPEDVQALADAVLDLLAHPDQMSALGAAGRERAIACFSTEAMMKKMIAVFRRLLSD